MAHWQKNDDRQALTAIRYRVFVEEQQVPEDVEMDAFDETSVHLLARSDEYGFIGCARIMPSGQIGRMAVLKHCRGGGTGSLLMTAAITEAKRQTLRPFFCMRNAMRRRSIPGLALSPAGMFSMRQALTT